MILPLDEPLAARHYGGKAAQLSTCLRAGLPVPPGIVLHSDLVARLTQGHLTSGSRLEQRLKHRSFYMGKRHLPHKSTNRGGYSHVN
jgi:phosphoenolpyruvate synthase/pyruvate phosphate dikinase